MSDPPKLTRIAQFDSSSTLLKTDQNGDRLTVAVTATLIQTARTLKSQMGGKEKKKKAPLTTKQREAWLPEGPSSASPSEAILPPPPPPWVDLPAEITANILHRLGAIEILETAQKVCSAWRNVCKDPCMWREIDMSNSGNLRDMPYQDLRIMCKHAVDRSQGQLVAINIEHFGTNELLEYIAER